MDDIFVTQATVPDFDEYVEELKAIWDTHWLTNMGPKHKQLQSELKKYLNVENLELLTNGHMAIELTLDAMQLKGEVITTPFTFASTTHAIVRNGLKPVFCDIDPETFVIDADKIEELITDQTCAILPVHVYGNICDVEKIDRIAKKHNLKVIYDAAHAVGETYKNKGIGVYGDASCFSFHATKVFNTIEGGAVSFHNSELGNRIYELKNFGIHGQEEVTAVGANAKMNEFCAAMGLCNLRHIEENINKRREIVKEYNRRFSSVPGIQLNSWQKDVKYNYAYYPVVFHEREFGQNRNTVFERLKQNRVYARKYFYPLITDFDCYKNDYSSESTPNALYTSNNVLTLPLYPDLSLEEVNYICDIVLDK